jgi:hypothetical protein
MRRGRKCSRMGEEADGEAGPRGARP